MQGALIDSAKKVNISQLKMPAVLHAGSAEDQSEQIKPKTDSKNARIKRRKTGKDSIYIPETAAVNLPSYTEQQLMNGIPEMDYLDHNGVRRNANENPFHQSST